mmetsp:Transcript_11873/g.25040  ORF Transcript_11873/g.25040 Transcript_11873/m.25040 type:complete len:1223 (+) Transcript_11873:432-4100(+)|eukprot:CAMPEP_0171373858 /NCGR_PEP_ID=MMETSP0879-20121228/13531_1 /TAXON_ID=67004 /ORGANISM="Thalassiosira weissflogii, Strain CCMP1336" /LENGTH=1222 /DNA_ID=CAMNT_0011883073 /DNA_START=342 /DNA_END=4010 /DNA_ORIENTATION=+
MADKNPFDSSAQNGGSTKESELSSENAAADFIQHRKMSSPLHGTVDDKAKSKKVGGLFNYLLSRKKQSSHTTNDQALPYINVEDKKAGNLNDSRRMSSRGSYHKFANAVGSYNIGPYDSDSDDENEPLFDAIENRYTEMNSSYKPDESRQVSTTWATQFSQVGKSAFDSATSWFYGSTIGEPGSRDAQEQNNKNSFGIRWVTPAFSLPTYVSSSLSSTITTMSSFNPFAGDDVTIKTGKGTVESSPNRGTNHFSNPTLLSKLASRSDILWATKTRNPYQGVIGRDVDYLLSRDDDNIFSSYLNPFSWIGDSSYGDGDLILQNGDDFPESTIHGAVRHQEQGDFGISVSEKSSEHANQLSPKLTKKQSLSGRQSQENVRKRNTPSDASVQAVKNLLSLVQRQVVMPMMIESKIRENIKKRSTSSFSSTSSFCDEPDEPGGEILQKQVAEQPVLPLLNSSPKMSSPDQFPEFPDFGPSPKQKKTGCKQERIPVFEKPSFDICSSSVQSPRSSPARNITANNESLPRFDESKEKEIDILCTRQFSTSSNENEGIHRNPNSALHAEMAARLSEGTLRAFRDLALDEATELHSALHFWTIRWERPILGWLEAGPRVWLSDEGYSPYDAGKKVSQIQAVLARRCAAIGEMQQHLWRANWQQGIGQWGMLGGGIGGEWTAVVGGNGGLTPAYRDNSESGDDNGHAPSSPRQRKRHKLEAMRIFNHSSVIGTNISNSRGGQIVIDQNSLVSWSIDALRVIRDQLYRSGSGVEELPFVHHWPREMHHFRPQNINNEGFFSDLPTWATEDVHEMKDVSRAAADEALISSSIYPQTPSRPRIPSSLGGVVGARKSSGHVSIIVSDLPSLTNEVSSLLSSIEVTLEEQRMRRLDRLKPPSRLRRNWWVAAFGLPAASYLMYKLTKRHGWFYLMKILAAKVSDIFRDHVSEPLHSIYQELFSHTGRLDVADRKARISAIESLKKMIRSWLDESFPKMTLEEKIRLSEAMDISLIEQSKEESIKHILELNSVVRMSLIEMQFIKKELFNALVAMDELMGSNEINMRIAAMTPAVIMIIAIRRAFRLLFYAFFQIGKSKEEIYASFRQTILDIERLIVMRDNPPPPPSPLPWGSTKPADTNHTSYCSKGGLQTLSADDLGMLLLHIHECRNILWQSPHRFPPDILRNLSEDLAELAGERGPVSVRQQLQIISRMTRTYPFMKPKYGIPFNMIMPKWN